MNGTGPGKISQLLTVWGAGEERALQELLPLVYNELRVLAAQQMRRERPAHTLQTTALVHEAFLRLVQQEGVRWESRSHFFAIAATAMRRVLVDHARRRRAQKRGGEPDKVSLEKVELAVYPDVGLLDLEECLKRLERLDPRQARVVELRFFSGCSMEEIAQILEVSLSTVKREWRMAKVWLRGELEQMSSDGS